MDRFPATLQGGSRVGYVVWLGGRAFVAWHGGGGEAGRWLRGMRCLGVQIIGCRASRGVAAWHGGAGEVAYAVAQGFQLP